MHSSRKATTSFIITIIDLLGIAILKYTCGLNNGQAGVIWIIGGIMLLIAILTIPPDSFQAELSSVMNSKCFVDTDAQQVFTDFVDTSEVANKVGSLWKGYIIGCWASKVAFGIFVFIRKYYTN